MNAMLKYATVPTNELDERILNWIGYHGMSLAAKLANNAGIPLDRFYKVAFGKFPPSLPL